MSILHPSEISIRTSIALAGIASIFVAPWWVPVLCIVLLSVRYPAWEVLIIALFMDLLWLPGDEGFGLPLFLMASAALVWMCAPLRAKFLRN